MRRWKRPLDARAATLAAMLLGSVVLAGCDVLREQKPGTLVVRSARVQGDASRRTLELGLDCRLSGPMQDALEHGIPITLRVDLRSGRWPSSEAAMRIELRYFPLTRRYQLRDLQSDEMRSFATPAYLIAALGSVRVALPPKLAVAPGGTSWQVTVSLDPSSLPGALRLPAFFEPAWSLGTAKYAWTDAAH